MNTDTNIPATTPTKTKKHTPPTTTPLRLRLRADHAKRLAEYPPVIRSRIVAIIIAAAIERYDLDALIKGRNELNRLGILLNQSLRINQGKAFDENSLRRAIAAVQVITRQ